MPTIIKCQCGKEWQLADGAPAICPSCGAFAAYSPTLPLGPATGMLGTLVGPTTNGSAPTLPAGAPTPEGFEILEVLGRGGMGIVYKARDCKLNRHVAIKMLLGGHAPSPDMLQRFFLEATTVARLEHPNIVQLHTIADKTETPFFVMEYVAGGSLAQLLKGKPLSPRQGAALVRTLATAVHAAHQAGVVHRDLKPANVLLTTDGTPKIADFGLAKQIDSGAGLTRSGDVLGTPSYMAPEQASGMTRQVTPLIDVYALGAILYEMLVGRPPFLADDPVRTILQVIGEEPIPPRRLQPGVPRDLETICLKCLEKKPARRYPSAAALADDLERYLDGRPITARPAGRTERLAKWVRRRPTTAALIGVSVVALLALFSIGTWFYLKEKAARERSENLNSQLTVSVANEKTAKEQADNQRSRAEGILALAGEKLEQFITSALDELEQFPQAGKATQDLQDASVPILEKLAQQDLKNPAMRALRARSARRLAANYLRNQDSKKAKEMLGQAAAEYEKLIAEFSDKPAYVIGLAETLNTTGLADDPNSAEADYRRALTLLKDHKIANDEARTIQAIIAHNLAKLLVGEERFDEARSLYLEAMALRQEMLPRDEEGKQRLGLAETLNNLGALERLARKPSAAVSAFEQSKEQYGKLPPATANRVSTRKDVAMLLANMAEQLEHRNEFALAAAAYTDAADQWRTLATDYPFAPEFLREAAYTQRRLAVALVNTSQLVKAQDALSRACRWEQRLALDIPQDITYAREWVKDLGYLADGLQRVGQKEEAEALWRRAADDAADVMRDRSDSCGPRVRSEVLHAMAIYFMSIGEATKALDRYEEAIRQRHKALARQPAHAGDRPALTRQYFGLAEAQLRLGQFAAVASSAEEGPALLPGEWGAEYVAATLLSRLAARIAGDAGLEEQQRRTLTETHAARAVALLRAAVKDGLPQPEKAMLGQKPELAPLRTRADFQELLREVDKTPAPPLK